MNDLEKLYDELHKMPAPKGFHALTNDLDISIFQYGDDLIGLANSYLSGRKVSPLDIHVDSDLGQRLQACRDKLEELVSLKEKYDKLANLLIDHISKSSL